MASLLHEETSEIGGKIYWMLCTLTKEWYFYCYKYQHRNLNV